ncbi:MAG: DNA repair exonuclease [Candidatus Aenigmarchaeota archaeon]|nr:DNA repair exonuclease [Candidatus Aenigmarchaeota archaeon]
MKITILPDMHLGYGWGGELEADPFDALAEAIEKSKDSDLILIVGDFFDSRTPPSEVIALAMQLLLSTFDYEPKVRLGAGIGKDVGKLTRMHTFGIPVVGIHGTHDRRSRGLLNPVQLLEKAGFVIHLHCNGVVLEKDGEKVCVQGLSGVPEMYTESVLKEWGPKPEEGCFNIFLIHQNLAPFMFATHLLPVERLPKGFDLYVSGHIHEPRLGEYDGKPLVVTGSSVATQLKEESAKPKCFWVADTKERTVAPVEFESQRKVYYLEFNDNISMENVEKEVRNITERQHNKKPIIRIKLKGKESSSPLEHVRDKYHERAIISFKKDFEDGKIEAKGLEEHMLSVNELGKRLLEQNLKGVGLDAQVFENVFELLLEGEHEKALSLLKEVK